MLLNMLIKVRPHGVAWHGSQQYVRKIFIIYCTFTFVHDAHQKKNMHANLKLFLSFTSHALKVHEQLRVKESFKL